MSGTVTINNARNVNIVSTFGGVKLGERMYTAEDVDALLVTARQDDIDNLNAEDLKIWNAVDDIESVVGEKGSFGGYAKTYVDSNDERVLSDAMAYTDGKASSVYRYRGTVLAYSDLPNEGNEPGDVWNVEDDSNGAGMNYAWAVDPGESNDQGHWDPLGPSLAGYATTEYVDSNDVQSDWEESDSGSLAYIRNKPDVIIRSEVKVEDVPSVYMDSYDTQKKITLRDGVSQNVVVDTSSKVSVFEGQNGFSEWRCSFGGYIYVIQNQPLWDDLTESWEWTDNDGVRHPCYVYNEFDELEFATDPDAVDMRCYSSAVRPGGPAPRTSWGFSRVRMPTAAEMSSLKAGLAKAETAVQPNDLGTAAYKDVPSSGNASNAQVVLGNDTRLSDARTPTAHALTHMTGGTDALTPASIGAAAATHTHGTSDVTGLENVLSGKASKSDATLAERGPNHDGFSAWTILRDGVDVTAQVISQPQFEADGNLWIVGDCRIPDDSELDPDTPGFGNATSLSWFHYSSGGDDVLYTATREALPGYVLGNQTEKPIPKLSDVPAVVAPSTAASDAGKAADAKATGDALDAKLSRAEAEDGFTEWEFIPSIPDNTKMVWEVSSDGTVAGWRLDSIDVDKEPLINGSAYLGNKDSTNITWEVSDYAFIDEEQTYRFTATRTRLRPTDAMEATWNGKASVEDAALVPVYSQTPTYGDKWTYSGVPDGWVVETPPKLVTDPQILQYYNWIVVFFDGNVAVSLYSTYAIDSNEVVFENNGDSVITATRARTDIIGYQLGLHADKPLVALEPIQFKEWFPGGEAKSIADCTSGLKFDWANANSVNHTVNVLSFCYTVNSNNDNSDITGCVVIPPYVDHEGVRYTVVGVANGSSSVDTNINLTSIVAPTTVKDIGDNAFFDCESLTSVSLPAAVTIGLSAFYTCTSLTSVSLPAVTTIMDDYALAYCTSLTSVSLPAATKIGNAAFHDCDHLTSVDFGQTARQSVPTLGTNVFPDLSQSGHTCRIIVPDSQYAAWTTAPGWSDLTQMGYVFVRHSEAVPVDKSDIRTVAGASGLQALFDKSAAGTATLAELNSMVTALYRAFGFSESNQ